MNKRFTGLGSDFKVTKDTDGAMPIKKLLKIAFGDKRIKRKKTGTNRNLFDFSAGDIGSFSKKVTSKGKIKPKPSSPPPPAKKI